MDLKKKFYLFKQSKNFCSVPWNHFKVSMNGDISTCVSGTETFGNLSENSIQEILKHQTLVTIREDLYKDNKISNCTKCMSYEKTTDSNDYKYLRDLYNPLFVKSTVDYSNNNSFILSGIDLHWSSICDLKCITCWANQSSSIALEQNLPILHTSTKEANSLIEYIVDNQHSLREIYLSGGEPTLNKHNLKLLQLLNKNNELLIRVNTNMMFVKNNQIIDELKKFPNVLFTISADGNKDRFNYIRRGANWDHFLSNLVELKKLHFKWRVNTVFFVGTALHLIDNINFFEKTFDITDFTINQLQMGHTKIRARNLPQKVKNLCLQQYKQFLATTNNKNLKGQLENCIIEINQTADEKYSEYLDHIDVLANTNWKLVFPELIDE